MPLKEELPKEIKELLKEQAVKEEDVLLALQSDLDDEGKFSPTWLIATKERLLVLQPEGEPKIRCNLSLKDYAFFKAEVGIGGGFLSAHSDGREMRLLRFTTATARKFQIAANALGRLVQEGQIPPEILAEDEGRKVCPKCGFPLDPVSGICTHCSPKGAVVRRLLSYIKPYYPTILLLISLLLLGTAFQVISPLITRNLVDNALVPRGPAIPSENVRVILLRAYVLLMAGLGIGSMLLEIFQQRIYAFLGQTVLFDIRRQLFEHLQFLSVSYYDKRQVGAVMSRVTQDTSALQEFLGWHIPFLFSQLVLLIGISIVVLSLNWRIALLVLIPAPIVAYLTRTVGRRIHHLFHRVWDRWSKVIAVLNSALAGIRVVKAFAQEEREARQFSQRAYDLTMNTIWAEQLWATYMPPLFFLFGATPLLIYYFGGKQVIFGTMTIGTLQAFISYTYMLLGPIQAVTRIINWLNRALAATERIFEILDTPPEILDDENAIPMPRIEGKVEFRNVTFGYDKYMPVLHNVSFEVQPGEIIGLVGRSGAGKTTIINLICRFYEAQEGQVLIDGVDIRKIKLKDLRNQIAIVPQDAYVFAGTVRENIAYGKPDATLEEIIEAAKAANAHEFIMNLPYGYDTPIGERGVMISGGERQRIAIARAILKNPRILILDEATSLVDTETEKQIQEALDRLMQGRTVFAIAHRLSTLSNAHRLMVIEDGRIVEMGTHKELLQKKGIYYQLVKLQREMSRLVAIGV